MMRSSFIVASAVASGVIAHSVAIAHVYGNGENNHTVYASTHKFQIPEKRMDGSGKGGTALRMTFGNRDCIGLGMFFSMLSDVAVRVECVGEPYFCHGDMFDPECGDYMGPPKFYLCKNGACVEERTPAKP